MCRSTRRGLLTAIIIAASLHVIVGAQGPGQNINVITGSDDQFTGDVFRQRQNESVVGISAVNPSNMIIAYNDYRTVDIADDFGVGTISPAQGFVAKLLNFFQAPWRLGRDGEPPKQLKTAAQAWIGLSFSNNGGKSFYGGLHPGRTALPSGNQEFLEHDVPIPSDVEGAWLTGAQRLHEFKAMSDPVMATTPNQFFLGGIAFNPPPNPSNPADPNAGNGKSIGFVSRFTDRNNSEQGQTVHFDGTRVLLETESNAKFVDKPAVAAGPNCRVYAAFVVFDQADPTKLSSKILFFRSVDCGENWTTQEDAVVVSQPLSRNQSPWIVIDPTNEDIVYIGWRVFSAQTGGWTNAIVGKKSTNGGVSFQTSFPWPVAPLLKAYDVPMGNLSGPNPTAPSPRSNAYPTATIDGKGAIHVAIQEYVYPASHPIALLRGRPLLPGVPVTVGVPRITTTTSYNGGVTWTLRKAADLGTNAAPAGAQFMPVLTAAGEPGPSCAGSSGPRSRVMLMFYDARNGGIGLAPGTPGYITGGDRRFDVRVTQASACSSSGLNFSPSEQVSQYTHTTESDATGEFPIVKIPGTELPAVNRGYSMFCGGNCAFTGDYIHLIPRVPYFQTKSGAWKPTTAITDPADRERLPAPVAQLVWADTRNAVTPTTGAPRPFPNPIDAMPWHEYGPPGTGLLSCVNPGARDQNIYTAEYTPGGLYAAAPTTFKTSSIPRSYPLYVENRTPFTKYYRLTIKPSANNTSANASFDYTDFDEGHANFGAPLVQRTSLTIGPISSVAGTVVVGPGVTTPVLITVEETQEPVEVNGVLQGGEIIPPPLGAMSSVTLRPSGTDPNAEETFTPAIDPTPIISHPLGMRGEAGSLIPSGGLSIPAGSDVPWPTPFGPNPFGPNPFGPNPFGPNPFGPNPFGPNPFGPNPFGPNQSVTVFEVTDISYIVTNEGEQTAAFRALANVTPKPGRVYQLLLNRAVPTPVLNPDTCVASDKWQAVPISVIANPFGPNPFGPNPFGPNPFGPNPFGPNPFGPNPAPIPEEFSNSTFYVKPAGSGDGIQTLNINDSHYVADPTPDSMVFTVREWLLVEPTNDPNTQPITADDVEVEIEATVPEFTGGAGGGYEDAPPAAGNQVPHHLAFTVQPLNASPGAPIAVAVAIRDTFDQTVTDSTLPVTIAIGTNPSEGILGGTLMATAVNGIATFTNLTIDKSGEGYTLVAASGALTEATSNAFTISPPVTITTQALPNATAGQAYSQQGFASGGTAPYTWSIDAIPNYPGFKLPPGLSLNSQTGAITGTPDLDAAEASWTFRLRVTDAFGQTDTQDLCIHVDESIEGDLVAVAVPVANANDVAQELAGDGVTIVAGSVQYLGAAAAIGTFSGGFSSVGLTSGIILSSGSVSGINPPNNSTGFTTINGQPGDTQLNALIPGFSTQDRAVLEFDFTVTDPNATTVKFDYVFASEEYSEYANTDFNDVFAFFMNELNGPTANFALIPGTNIPVSINNVNNGNSDPNGDPTPHHPEFFVNNVTGTIATQADGFTKVLSIQANVTPGNTYHLKIAIADAGDAQLDSWVLLKSGSLTVVCPIIPNCPMCQ